MEIRQALVLATIIDSERRHAALRETDRARSAQREPAPRWWEVFTRPVRFSPTA
jgi:hypothetical protein